jgi:hypothetical protein
MPSTGLGTSPSVPPSVGGMNESMVTGPKFGSVEGQVLSSSFGDVGPTKENPFQIKTEEESHGIRSTSEIKDGGDVEKTGFRKENQIDLYNLSLEEIVNTQLEILDKNIREFKKSASEIFEQDMKLIEAKKNYMKVLECIEEEEIRMEELSEALDFVEKYMDGLNVGQDTEMSRCCRDFERVSDLFYRKVEGFRDDQDEVMSLVNENYNLVSIIDEKLDKIEE